MTEAEKLPWYRLVKLFGRTTDEALSQGNMAAHVDGWGQEEALVARTATDPQTLTRKKSWDSVSLFW